ncbi:hypothetical protein V5F29_04795 [Xanthobacter aminoxidans]|jgi:hypothetical protein|uniref:hypothetical protein n=1 Tax=Xanthobacter aminoxidans TaxID=186280 RepID=UPI003728E76E
MVDSSVPPRPSRPRNPLRVALRFAFRVVVGIVILLDELVRPLYRPLLDWLAALKLVQRFEAWVGGLPAYAVLVLIAVPYGVVEPLKFLALIHIANGHVRTGTFLFLLAHLVSFVLIERIFTAGKAQLMTVRWMAYVIETAASVHRSVSEWLRLAELKRRARALWRWARLRLR